MTELLTEKEVSDKLGRKPGTLRRWRAAGYGPAFVLIKRSPRYRAETVDEWIHSQEREAGE